MHHGKSIGASAVLQRVVLLLLAAIYQRSVFSCLQLRRHCGTAWSVGRRL